MNHLAIKLKVLHPRVGQDIARPWRFVAVAAGSALGAPIDAPLCLLPGERKLVPCGFSMQLPPGHEAQIRPRSGLALRHGVTCLNAPGTIDADYRGEVGVLLVNLGQEPYTIEVGGRIAQMVIAVVPLLGLEVVTELDQSGRGAGGFGSTGT